MQTPHLFQLKSVVRKGYKAKPPIGSDYLLPQALRKIGGGFTIIEILAAVFVLTVGMIGVLTVIQQTMAYGEILNERLIAIYLVQEGIEIVRNIRDGNWLEPASSWDADLTAGDWEGDWTMTDSLDSYQDRNLKIDNGFYKYSLSGTSTPFRRKITISDKLNLDGQPGDDQMKVTVTVSWQARGATSSISAQEELYNWR